MPSLEALRVGLLRAGLQPRCADRYIDELRDHLEDLRAEGERAGRHRAAALAAAWERLGPAEQLVAAAAAQPALRSRLARWPWGLPLVAVAGLVGGHLLFVGTLMACVDGLGVLVQGHLMPPGWLPAIAEPVFGGLRLVLPVLLAWGVASAAHRRRMRPLWPLLAVALLCLVGPDIGFHADWPTLPRTWSLTVSTLPIADDVPFGWGAYAWRVGATLLPVMPAAALLWSPRWLRRWRPE